MTLEEAIAWCVEHHVQLDFDEFNGRHYVFVYRSVDYHYEDELMGEGATVIEAVEQARDKWKESVRE